MRFELKTEVISPLNYFQRQIFNINLQYDDLYKIIPGVNTRNRMIIRGLAKQKCWAVLLELFKCPAMKTDIVEFTTEFGGYHLLSNILACPVPWRSRNRDIINLGEGKLLNYTSAILSGAIRGDKWQEIKSIKKRMHNAVRSNIMIAAASIEDSTIFYEFTDSREFVSPFPLLTIPRGMRDFYRNHSNVRYAAEAGNLQLVKELIKTESTNLTEALYTACRGGNEEVFDYLSELVSYKTSSIIPHIAHSGNYDWFRRVISDVLDVKKLTKSMSEAIKSGHLNIIKLLISRGVPLSVHYYSFAKNNGYKDIAWYLAQCELNPDIDDNYLAENISYYEEHPDIDRYMEDCKINMMFEL